MAVDETIYYNSPVGTLRLKNSGPFICELSFVKTVKHNKIAETNIAFTQASSPIIKKCIGQLDDYFSGKNLCFNLQLSQPGTGFQQTVWSALLHIPEGKTLSYLQLSKNIGNSKAIRAVGTANGKNNIAIIVPCHRVIGSNGTLVGYGGDLWRKRWLLAHEAKYCSGVQTLF
ncbi:MAG: methylated-DNA--[protein]-cysteine S-methyltransferase [Ferruginibacter sp.]